MRKYSQVCQHHFKEDQLNVQKNRLNKSAVPTVNTGEPKEEDGPFQTFGHLPLTPSVSNHSNEINFVSIAKTCHSYLYLSWLRMIITDIQNSENGCDFSLEVNKTVQPDQLAHHTVSREELEDDGPLPTVGHLPLPPTANQLNNINFVSHIGS